MVMSLYYFDIYNIKGYYKIDNHILVYILL